MKLTIENLEKSYGRTKALAGFSYEFTPGIYGILGANGAGKSTLFGLLTDTLRRQSGQILWDGTDILKLGRRYRAKVGYMPQAQGYYPQMSAREFLYYMGEVKGLPRAARKTEAERLLEAVDLWDVADRKLGQFSGGMRQRALLAQAMLGDPELLILDEPTAGVDPRERIRIRGFIAGLARERIVLLATHVVTDVECIADRVLLMNKGKLLKADRPENAYRVHPDQGGGKALHAGGDRALPAAVRLRLAVPAAGGAGAPPHRRRAARRVRPGGVRPEPGGGLSLLLHLILFCIIPHIYCT